MTRFTRRVRVLFRNLIGAGRLDADMDDEMRFHVDMESARLIREHGLPTHEARRRALVAFGGVEKYKDAGRDARGVRWVDVIMLDTKLGVRMLLKHRGLTMIGGFAMAVAIGIGAAAFEVFNEMLAPALPYSGGERIVSLQLPAPDGGVDRRVMRDFAELRGQLRTIEQLGAFRTVQHNLSSPYGPPEPIKLAEMSATGFELARTPPLLGRYLVQEDEREGVAPVMVIGYQAWQSRFASDPAIVGRALMLGGVPHTVVGVMPEGFAFPYNHQFWMPLRAKPLQYERRQGPALYLFGRLTEDVTLEQAQAELTTFDRLAVTLPESQVRRHPRVLPYPREHVDLSQPTLVWVMRVAQLLVGVLAVLVAVNIAILMYARTVTRLGEIAVRTALGANRRRILAQLFTEALVLALVGAAAGLLLANRALEFVQSLARANGGTPFWIRFELSGATVGYAVGLAVVAAAIMGVLPGVKATGKRFAATLQSLNERAGSRLGAVWTTLVVAQVGLAVAVLPASVYLTWQIVNLELDGPGFAAERFVVGSVFLAEEAAEIDMDVVRLRQLELMSRLESEPGIAAVTFSSTVPGFAGSRQLEFERHTQVNAEESPMASTVDVGVDLFHVYEATLLAGRVLDAGDVGASGNVVVNRRFVDVFLAGGGALGRRFRYLGSGDSRTREQWYQIVGVVADFPSFPPVIILDGEPTVYHPAAPGSLHPFVVSARYAGVIPPNVAERIRTIAAEIDPVLQLRRVTPLSTFYDDIRSFWRYIAWGVALVTASMLLLSAAGIYAMMSFTVARRTREIGIRTALGAHPRRILFGVFGRAAGQLSLGVLIGSVLSGALVASSGVGVGTATVLVGVVGLIMMTVGLVAALGPARRSLRIQASEALRTEA